MKRYGSAFFIFASISILLIACQPAPETPAPASPPATPTAFASPPPSPTSTAVPITPTTTPKSIFAPSETIDANLLHRVPAGFVSALPEGLAMDVYQMAGLPDTDEGYEPILAALGAQSRINALTQGRYYWDTVDLAQMELDNAALAPFGYRLASRPVGPDTGARWFTLYRGDQVILDPITELGPVSVNHSGTDFALLVQGSSQFQLVRKDSLEEWAYIAGGITHSRPQFLGDDLTYVRVNAETLTATPSTPGLGNSLDVFRNGQVIYTARYFDRPAASGLIGFWTFGEHWALETVGRIVIDGQDLNAVNGYDASYEFHLLGGKPLFFFEQAGKLNVSYDGRTAVLPFQSVPHYGCCSGGMENPLQMGDQLMLLYASQGGNWFYIELAAP